MEIEWSIIAAVLIGGILGGWANYYISYEKLPQETFDLEGTGGAAPEKGYWYFVIGYWMKGLAGAALVPAILYVLNQTEALKDTFSVYLGFCVIGAIGLDILLRSMLGNLKSRISALETKVDQAVRQSAAALPNAPAAAPLPNLPVADPAKPIVDHNAVIPDGGAEELLNSRKITLDDRTIKNGTVLQ